MQPLLSVENLRVSFGGVAALNGVSLQVGAGEAVGLVGALGSGKTTLLRAIAGVARPDSGSLVFDGETLDGVSADARVRRGIALVPAGGGFFPTLSVRENLSLVQGGSGDEVGVDRLIAELPVLGERLRQRAGSLSGGEQRQLAIARGLLAGPRMLALDEPLMGLSPVSAERVTRLLERLRASGTGLLIVEERPTEVLQAMVSRLIGLRSGVAVPASEIGRAAAVAEASPRGALDFEDVEVLGIPLSARRRRALQTIAQARGQAVGEVVAGLIGEHVDSNRELWQ